MPCPSPTDQQPVYSRQRREKYRQCTYEVTLGARSHNNCRRGKAVSITYCECVSVALVICMLTAYALLCCHLWPVRFSHTFPYYITKGTILWGEEEIIEQKCVFRFSLQLLSKTFTILR
jgi:hypothetical protein